MIRLLLLLRLGRGLFSFGHRLLQGGEWSKDRMSMGALGLWENLRRIFAGPS